MSKGTVYTQQLKLRQKVAPKTRITSQAAQSKERKVPKLQAIQTRKVETAQKNLASATKQVRSTAPTAQFQTSRGDTVQSMTPGLSDQYGGVKGYAKHLSETLGYDVSPDELRGIASHQNPVNARQSQNTQNQIESFNKTISQNQETPEDMLQRLQNKVQVSNDRGFAPSTAELWRTMPQGSLSQDQVIEDLIKNGFYGEAVKVRQGQLDPNDEMVTRMRGTTKKEALKPQVQTNPYASQSYSPATGSSLAGATANFSNPATSSSMTSAAAIAAARKKALGSVASELQSIGAVPQSNQQSPYGQFDPSNPTAPYGGYLAGQAGAKSYNPQGGENWTSYQSPQIQTKYGGEYGGYKWNSDAVPMPAQQQYGADYGLLGAMRNQYETARSTDQANRDAASRNVQLQAQQEAAGLEKDYTNKIAQLKQSWAKRGIMDSSFAIEGEKEVLLESQNAQERLKANLAEQLTKLASEGAMSMADAEVAFQKMQYEMMQDSQATAMKMQELQQSAMKAQQDGDLALMKFYQTERQNLVEAEYKRIMSEQIMGNLTGRLSDGSQTKESSRAGAQRNIDYAEYMGYQYDPYSGEIRRDANGNPLMNPSKVKSPGGGGGSGTGSGSSTATGLIALGRSDGLTDYEIYDSAPSNMKSQVLAELSKPKSNSYGGLASGASGAKSYSSSSYQAP